MKFKIITIKILIISLYLGCKDERTPEIRNISQEIKDWMFFDTGTWWLYQNVQTGELDSQYVTNSNIFYLESENIKGQEYYKEQSAKILTNSNLSFLITTDYVLKENNKGTEGSYTFIYFTPNNKPLTVGERRSSCAGGNGFIEMTSIQENFTLDNVYYNTKITVFDNKDCTEHGDSIQYQLFKGVGIINKKNLTKNEEWKLIKYHIKLNKN